MFRNINIGTKILIVLLATALGALLAIALISYTEMLNLTRYSQDANINLGMTASEKSRKALLDQAEEYLAKIAVEQAGNSNAVLAQVQTEVTAMADYISALYKNPDNFAGHELPLPNQTENGVASAKYILAPGVQRSDAIARELLLVSNAEYMFAAILSNNPTLYNTYLGTESGISYRYSRSNSYNPAYDPRKRGWYITAMSAPGKTLWMDTYLDAYGQICVTCAASFNGTDGEPAGVAAVDITLISLKKDILSTRIGEGGYAFLIDEKGKYIAHPDYDKAGFVREPLYRAEGAWLQILRSMREGKRGVGIATIDNIENYVAYAPLSTTDWTLGVTVPIEEVTLPADETKEKIDLYTDESQAYIEKTLSDVLMRFIILFAVCSMLFVLFSFVLSNTITRPIKDLIESVHHIGRGELDSKIVVRGRDEIGQLAEAFNSMARDLKIYIKDLAEAISEKERINSELTVAGNIQNDMLPHIFPKFSNLPNLEIHAEMVTAKEVGGDFYDCFFLDANHTRLCLVIADVSDKGVPASLFMVIAKILIKTHMMGSATPAEAIARVNPILCADNSSCMFVTAFVGVLDTETGRFDYVNCGHNPPLICRKGEKFNYMTLNRALAMAIMDDSPYIDESVQLNPGDTVYMYTDGVTEAMNEKGELFGESALQETLNSRSCSSPEELDRAVREAVTGFAGDTEQSDDITTLVVKYTGER